MHENKKVEMETNEYYLELYDQKIQELEEKGELWRQILSKEEFLEKLIAIKQSFRYSENLNEYHNQRNFDGLVSVLYHTRVTFEEAKRSLDKINIIFEKKLKRNAPKLKKRLRKMKLPLNSIVCREIFSGLYYGQITEEDIPSAVLEAYKESSFYSIDTKNAGRSKKNDPTPGENTPKFYF